MTLVDTSVWVDHFRSSEPTLARLLQRRLAVGHPAVLGELACGNLRRRKTILADLARPPAAIEAKNQEVLETIEWNSLYGMGIGWIDAHLIASALLSRCKLWTKDKRLERAAHAANDETGV